MWRAFCYNKEEVTSFENLDLTIIVVIEQGATIESIISKEKKNNNSGMFAKISA